LFILNTASLVSLEGPQTAIVDCYKEFCE